MLWFDLQNQNKNQSLFFQCTRASLHDKRTSEVNKEVAALLNYLIVYYTKLFWIMTSI